MTIGSCYKVPHKEDESEVAINMQFNEDLFKLQKKVAPNDMIVGWFTTSKRMASAIETYLTICSEIDNNDMTFMDYYARLMSTVRQGKGGVHPIVLMVDTAPTNGKIDIKVYTLLKTKIGKVRSVIYSLSLLS